MGDLAGALSRKLNISNGKKLTTKTITQSRRAHETEDDIAILSMILPGEKFNCCLNEDCRYGNSKENTLGKLPIIHYFNNPDSNQQTTRAFENEYLQYYSAILQ